jgi:hypothetical protein
MAPYFFLGAVCGEFNRRELVAAVSPKHLQLLPGLQLRARL